MKQMYLKCMAVLLLSVITISAYAQQKVTGTVTEKSGQPIPGVSVTEKGTKNGTATDANGRFSLTVKTGAVLTFSSIGLTTQEVKPGQSATISVVLTDDQNALSEVVVTALGIKREKKSLGYALQEVKGETLADAKEPNIVNALSGKVAGLQITRSGNGPGGSSKITLRGNTSLTGKNQPLIVVDGIPMDNFIGNQKNNNDYFNPTLDMGNGLSDLNAEDIESMTVLKGAAAAALYGSRAGNGAILITTKSGKSQTGLGITVSSSIGIESIFTRPKLQNDFGQGTGNIYDEKSRLSWGPKIAGQDVKKWDGSTAPLSAYDNIDNYFEKGITSNQSVSFQQQLKSTSLYTSYNRLDDKSMVPGIKLTRNNFTVRALTKFGKDDRWTTDTKVQYINSIANNRPQGGPRPENTFYTLGMLPRSIDIRDFSAGRDANNKMIWYNEKNEYNPYWASKYNLNEDIRDRFLLNGSLKYEFNSWLNAEIKGGADMYTTNNSERGYAGVSTGSTGKYSTGKASFRETNYSTLITAKKDNLFGKLGGVVTLGGNLMDRESSSLTGAVGTLKVPDLFTLNNSSGNPVIEESLIRKSIYSVYGTLGLNYDGYLFLDGTFRNDWSSALSKANQSYFYPSISTSLVFTEMMSKIGSGLPSWISYGKIRGSYAIVGNDMEAYQLYNTYTISKDPRGNINASKGDILFDPNVRSELIKSFEAGLEMRFLNSRVGFDFAVYKSNATRQLIDLPMDALSGYKFRKINAGDIENKGLELLVDGRILENKSGLNWTSTLNFSINRNIVNSLYADVSQYPLGGYDDIQVLAVAGQRYGEIYGSKFARVTDRNSPFFGKMILNGNGLPTAEAENSRLGNQQASSLLGITNAFSYKGIGLSFQVDARFGGKIFSGTLADMQQFGTASNTVVNGLRENMVVDGVVFNTAKNEYEKNTISTTPQLYWQTVAGRNNLGFTEANLYDASNIRLRNVQLSYDLPHKFLAKTPMQRLKVGVSCNNVWLIQSHMNGLDPESVYATGGNATGFENGGAPTSRTFLFNLTVGF